MAVELCERRTLNWVPRKYLSASMIPILLLVEKVRIPILLKYSSLAPSGSVRLDLMLLKVLAVTLLDAEPDLCCAVKWKHRSSNRIESYSSNFTRSHSLHSLLRVCISFFLHNFKCSFLVYRWSKAFSLLLSPQVVEINCCFIVMYR
jgi:hypothetical protein